MPKKKVEAPKRELSRRQLTHRQRESRIQRFTLWGGLVVIIAVIALVAVGVYTNKIKPNTQVVFEVGDKSYNMGYFIDATDYLGQGNFSYMQSYGIDYAQFLGYYIKSFANSIQENQILKEAAAKPVEPKNPGDPKLDEPIKVTDDEVKKHIKDNSLPNNKAVYDAVYGALLDQKLTAAFDKQQLAKAPHRAVLAMFLESQSQVDAIKARIAKGETFNAIAESSSLDSTTKAKSGDLGWVPMGVIPTVLGNADDKTLEELVFKADTQINVLTQAEDATKGKSMGYWLIQVVDIKAGATETATPAPTATPANTDQIKANVMLLPSQELALALKSQLASGADFATVAKANSQYTGAATDGGILDYFSKGKLGTAADAVLFPDDKTKMPRAGQLLDPIADDTQNTTGGFWLAQVTGIENERALDGENRSTLTSIVKQTWRNNTWTDNSSRVVDHLDQTKIDYATAKAIDRYNKK